MLKEMKENKTEIVKVRLTPEQKQQIKDYAEKYGLTMSEVVRDLCEKIFYKEEQ